jgi:hypothetical protein
MASRHLGRPSPTDHRGHSGRSKLWKQRWDCCSACWSGPSLRRQRDLDWVGFNRGSALECVLLLLEPIAEATHVRLAGIFKFGEKLSFLC